MHKLLTAALLVLAACGGKSARATNLEIPSERPTLDSPYFYCFPGRGEVLHQPEQGVLACADSEELCGLIREQALKNGGLAGIDEVGACTLVQVVN